MLGNALLLALALVSVVAGPAIAEDAAEDQYQFIVGLIDKKLYDLAAKEAERFVADYPRHAKADHARYRLGQALFEQDRLEEAAAQFQKVLARRGFEFEAEAAFRLAQCSIAAERYAEAKPALERALAADKDYLKQPATFLLAEVLFRSGDFAGAAARYETVLAADPEGANAKDARYGLAWCAFRTRQYDVAQQRIGEFLKAHAGDALEGELLFLAGECHFESKRPAEALAAYERVGAGPFLDAALRGQGFALAALDDPARAAARFAALVERVPDSRFAREARLQGAIQFLKAKAPDRAEALLAGKAADSDAELCYWRARAKAERKDAAGALADLDRALRSDPPRDLAERIQVARGDALFDLGRAADAAVAYGGAGGDYPLHAAALASFDAGRLDEAAELARQFLSRHAESPYRGATLLVLGECQLQQKDHAGAAQSFAAAAKTAANPSDALRATSRLGWASFLGGDSAAAARAFGEVAAARGADALREDALGMLGRALDASGDAEPAAAAYRRYLEEYPAGAQRPEVLFGLARLAAPAQAIPLLEELAERHAEHPIAPAALFALAEHQNQAGQKDAAIRRYRELLERSPRDPNAPAARYGLAFCLFEAGQSAEAAAALRPLAAAAGLDPALATAAAELAIYAEQKAGDVPRALAALERYRAGSPPGPRLLGATRAVAAALGEQGDKARAEKLWDDLAAAATEAPVAAAALVEAAYAKLDRGDAEGAERAIAAALSRAPADPAVLEAAFHAGEAQFAGEQWPRAIALYDRAAAPECRLADRALYKRGFARLKQGDLAGAGVDFASLAERYGKSTLYGEALFLAGEMRYREDHLDQAAPWFQRLCKELPNHETAAKALFRLGVVHAKAERWPDAERALTELLRRFPKFDSALEADLWRGRALAALDNPRGARQAFDRVAAEDKGVLAARARLELGRLHAKAGEGEKALAEFLKVAVLYAAEEEVAEGLYLAGLTLEQLGQKDQAAAQYQEVVAKHPKSAFAAKARERLAERESF